MDDTHICLREDGSPWPPRVLTHAFARLIRASGLTKVRLHDLRHGHATHLLVANTHPKVVQERLGQRGPEDLGLVARMLEAHPNLFVDIAARLGELGRQPYTSRAFFVRHADRILFGTDTAADPAVYRLHYRFLETWDESFDYGTEAVPGQGRRQIHGLGLPDDVHRAVYRDNARRVLRLDAGSGTTS